jgi:hypothetical protein
MRFIHEHSRRGRRSHRHSSSRRQDPHFIIVFPFLASLVCELACLRCTTISRTIPLRWSVEVIVAWSVPLCSLRDGPQNCRRVREGGDWRRRGRGAGQGCAVGLGLEGREGRGWQQRGWRWRGARGGWRRAGWRMCGRRRRPAWARAGSVRWSRGSTGARRTRQLTRRGSRSGAAAATG